MADRGRKGNYETSENIKPRKSMDSELIKAITEYLGDK